MFPDHKEEQNDGGCEVVTMEEDHDESLLL